MSTASALFDGIAARIVPTGRLRANVLERPADQPGDTVVFVHGNCSSALFFQPTMLALPPSVRALAVDLRGFGDSETLPVDATRGVRDFSDDVWSVVDALGIDRVHLVGWSMGGGVVLQQLLDRPDAVASVTLISPVAPFGFGGTTLDGTRLTADDAGVGGGGASPDFVARLKAGDTTDEAPTSPRSVFRSSYVAPGYTSEHEDIWVESMLSTKTGEDNYPGDLQASEHWPGFAAGTRGVLNTMAPRYFDVSGIVELARKPSVLWIHGLDDAIVGDETFFDLNTLGKAGVVPGWPGEQVAPPQPMVAQTRQVLDSYADAGGRYREIAQPNCGHSAHLEHQDVVVAALLEVMGETGATS
ncbi:alpha/beta fold hydrolase [Humibacter ginsenosidimutans]|uniref:Alpha/beta hydrolase n=1 Tax=Humibacter ginsenosidimutans TaxID=2599293 RepID=A0A5B8LZD3_9MICO|nr:alpha/beta hydrolase [Humibacter ginsenosidimutans]QDZ13426.1 alpha/beta hydrolase [Humibacter ginsenosidimutans]